MLLDHFVAKSSVEIHQQRRDPFAAFIWTVRQDRVNHQLRQDWNWSSEGKVNIQERVPSGDENEAARESPL